VQLLVMSVEVAWTDQRLLTTTEEAVMRKFLVIAVFAFVTVAMLAPPVLAQAPAPKVTITGLFDQVTSFGRNYNDADFTRNNDTEWYARTRFRPDFTFEVGRTKAVMGFELDLSWGQTGAASGGAGKGVAADSAGHPGVTSSSSLNTDVAGIIEIKWIYTEFDLTGKDSLLPFIPVPSVARAGLRSEEHTSELQSRGHLVCRLLLEKKKLYR